jgi:hypothetical protein
VKSVSTLWAVAEPAVAAVIEQAHQAAIKDASSIVCKGLRPEHQHHLPPHMRDPQRPLPGTCSKNNSQAGGCRPCAVALGTDLLCVGSRWLVEKHRMVGQPSLDMSATTKLTSAAGGQATGRGHDKSQAKSSAEFAARDDQGFRRRVVRASTAVGWPSICCTDLCRPAAMTELAADDIRVRHAVRDSEAARRPRVVDALHSDHCRCRPDLGYPREGVSTRWPLWHASSRSP